MTMVFPVDHSAMPDFTGKRGDYITLRKSHEYDGVHGTIELATLTYNEAASLMVMLAQIVSNHIALSNDVVVVADNERS